MCIRDRPGAARQRPPGARTDREPLPARPLRQHPARVQPRPCLLYTSDAADERSSVDLGGRRIIKKKYKRQHVDKAERETKQENKL